MSILVAADTAAHGLAEVHDRFLQMKPVLCLVDNPKFQELWRLSDSATRHRALHAINNRDPVTVREWMAEHPSIDVEDLPISQLRQRGSRLAIPRYSRMSKEDLILAIKKAGEKK